MVISLLDTRFNSTNFLINWGYAPQGLTQLFLPCAYQNYYVVMAREYGGHSGNAMEVNSKTVSSFYCASDVFTTTYYHSNYWPESDWITIGY